MTKILMLILTLLVFIPVSASCSGEITQLTKTTVSASSEDYNLTWMFDTETGVLTINGTGTMTDYTNDSPPPWITNNIKIVNINNGVTSIGSYAFFGFDSLTSVTIPDSVTSINSCAFSWCDSLTSVTIPDSVTSIGNFVFSNCCSLTSIIVSSSNEYFLSDEYGVLFNKNKNILIQYPIGNSPTEYIIPDSITSIDVGAFSGCINLTNVIIPDSVISIGYNAFSGCISLTNVIIPDNVTSIYSFAFCECDSLTSITIPDSITSIGYNAFYGCDNMTSALFKGDVPDTFEDAVFDGMSENFIIYFIEGKSGWTTPTWTTLEGTIYNTTTFAP